jgi:hypothetical protein
MAWHIVLSRDINNAADTVAFFQEAATIVDLKEVHMQNASTIDGYGEPVVGATMEQWDDAKNYKIVIG